MTGDQHTAADMAHYLLSEDDPHETLKDAVARLAKLPELEYEQQRCAVAKRFEIRRDALDKAVERVRNQSAGADDANHTPFIADVEHGSELTAVSINEYTP